MPGYFCAYNELLQSWKAEHRKVYLKECHWFRVEILLLKNEII